jgi:hypothetical protein
MLALTWASDHGSFPAFRETFYSLSPGLIVGKFTV